MFVLLAYSVSNAQAIRNYTLEINCKSRTYNSSQSILEFKWHYRSPNASAQYVYRKNKDRYDWGSPYRILGNRDSSFNDTIVTGNAYEYMVEKDFGPDGYPALGFAYSAHHFPAVTNRGKIILIIDSTNKSFLENNIRTYRNDLIGDGWDPIVKWVSPLTSVSQIKSYIVSQYNTDPSNVKAVTLIGDVAVPYSGDFKASGIPPADGHVVAYGPSHEGAWPTDLYYGCMTNATWPDASVNNTLGARPANHNIPSDGKFDVTELSELVTLQVGRIDLSEMTLFKNDVPDTGHIERELLKRYFIKNHNFKHKITTFRERCLMDDNFGVLAGPPNEHFAGNAYRNLSILVADSVVKTGDYRADLNNNDYLWSFGFGSGSYLNCAGVASTVQLASNSQTLNSVFSGLFGSYFGDWDTANNFLRAPLAAKGSVLNTFWCGRPHWNFHHMGLGETIGYSAMRSQNNFDSALSAYYGFNIPLYPVFGAYSYNDVHQSLMGDPAVRMQPFDPIHNLLARQDSCNLTFKLTWSASLDTAVHSYYIYRSKHIDSSFTQIGTTSNLFWKDNSPLTGDNVYMVRGLKLQVSGSGTYYNLSQGIFDTISTTELSLPLVNAGRDTSVCKNEMVKLGVKQSSNRTSYLWNIVAYTRDTVSIKVNSTNAWILRATDTLSTCIKRDTIQITALNLPVSESITASNPTCMDTVNWSSTLNNGISFRYVWHFNGGIQSDTSGLGLNSPGNILYSSSGLLLGTLKVVNPLSNCQNIDSQYVNVNCVALPLKEAEINCTNTIKGKEITFLVYDNEQYLSYTIEGYNGKEWKLLATIPASTNRNYEYLIENNFTYSEIKIKGKNGVNEMVDLGSCGNSEIKAEWEVFPNPIFDKFTINYNGNTGQRNTELTISNSQGSIIMNKKVSIINGQIDLSLLGYPEGIYTLTIRTGDKVEVFKLVKL